MSATVRGTISKDSGSSIRIILPTTSWIFKHFCLAWSWFIILEAIFTAPLLVRGGFWLLTTLLASIEQANRFSRLVRIVKRAESARAIDTLVTVMGLPVAGRCLGVGRPRELLAWLPAVAPSGELLGKRTYWPVCSGLARAVLSWNEHWSSCWAAALTIMRKF